MPPPATSNPSTITKRPVANDFRMDVEGDGALGAQLQFRHFVAPHKRFRARNGLQGGRIDHPLDGINFAFHLLRGQLELVAPALAERGAAQPEQPGLEPAQLIRRGGLQRRHRAALDKNLLGQGDADGFARLRPLRRRGVPAFNRLDSADLVGRREDQPVARLERAGLDPARPGCGGRRSGKCPGWAGAAADGWAARPVETHPAFPAPSAPATTACSGWARRCCRRAWPRWG